MTDAATLAEQGFQTVFGHELVGELPNFVHRPYLVVTMADLWPRFEDQLTGPSLAGVHLVDTLELSELVALEERLPRAAAIIGLGGGQALDVAKFLAWTRRLPLFQVPTATTVNAPFGHRAGLRDEGRVRYLGWTVPEAVYIDFDVIGSAPPNLNRSGDRRRALLPHGTLRLAARRPARPVRGALAVRPGPGRRRRDRHGRRRRRARRDPRRARRLGSGPSSTPIAGAARRSTTPAGIRATSRASSTSSSTTSSGSPAATSSMASRSGWGSSRAPCCRTTSRR